MVGQGESRSRFIFHGRFVPDAARKTVPRPNFAFTASSAAESFAPFVSDGSPAKRSAAPPAGSMPQSRTPARR